MLTSLTLARPRLILMSFSMFPSGLSRFQAHTVVFNLSHFTILSTCTSQGPTQHIDFWFALKHSHCCFAISIGIKFFTLVFLLDICLSFVASSCSISRSSRLERCGETFVESLPPGVLVVFVLGGCFICWNLVETCENQCFFGNPLEIIPTRIEP